MKLKDQELLALVRRETDDAQGYDADILATKRQNALDYYYGKMKAAAEGRSSIVSKDVADTVHALLAQVSRIFQTSLIQFEPDTEQDENQAQMESDYVRKMLDQSDGNSILSQSAHDALLIGNGWIKVTVEPTTTINTEQYGDLDEWQIEAVRQPTAEAQEVDVKETKNGYSVRRSDTTYQMKIECMAPEHMLFTQNSGQFAMEDLRYVGERKLYTSSELKAMGVSDKDIHSIPESEDDYWPGTRAREGIYQDETDAQQASQDAERLRECFDCHMRVDLEDNGESELRHIIFGGNVLITNDPAYCMPYATGSPVPVPHRVQGIGMFELMGSIQEAKTNVLRNYVDNLKVMNQSRLGVLEGQVNMADATSGRLNGLIRMKRPDAIMPIPSTDIGMQAIQGLNYLDTVRSQRGGASVDTNDADRQLMQSSAVAASGAIANAEKMAGWYSHNLVNTLLKSVYLLIHKKLRREMPGTVKANLGGKWVDVDPGQWVDRQNRMEIVAGMTTTERTTKIMGLNQVIQQQANLLAQGGEGVITSKAKMHSAMSDWIRASEIGQPDEYLIDPDSDQAKQASKQQMEQAQAQQQKMEQQQAQILELQKKIEADKVAFDYYKQESDIKFKYYDAALDSEEAEARITTDAAVKMHSVKNNETA